MRPGEFEELHTAFRGKIKTEEWDPTTTVGMKRLEEKCLSQLWCPVEFFAGLLTCDTIEQAVVRSSQDGHNKGAEAAAAALLQINAARHLGAV